MAGMARHEILMSGMAPTMDALATVGELDFDGLRLPSRLMREVTTRQRGFRESSASTARRSPPPRH